MTRARPGRAAPRAARAPTPGRVAGVARTATDPGPRFPAGPYDGTPAGGRSGSPRRDAGADHRRLRGYRCIRRRGHPHRATPTERVHAKPDFPVSTSPFRSAGWATGTDPPGGRHRGRPDGRPRQRAGLRPGRVVKFLCTRTPAGVGAGEQLWRTVTGPPQASAEGSAHVCPRADPSVPKAASISSRRDRSLRPSRHRRRTSRGRDRRNRGRHRPSRHR